MKNRNEKFFTLNTFYEWIASWKFPVFVISLLVFFVLLIFSIWLIPPVEDNPLGRFAKTFRIWCFGQDPTTQKDQDIYLLMFILDPLLLIGILILFWYRPLKEIWKEKTKNFYLYIGYGLIPVLFALLFFLYLAFFENPTFSLDWKSLRIHVPLKSAQLIDQRGKPVRFSDYKGKVLIITSFYSHCHYMCPAILKHIHDIAETISDKNSIRVFAISMDPERDTVERLQKIAKIYNMDKEYYYFLTGNVREVNQYLDYLNFSRQYNPETEEWNHANIILIVDKNNHLAFRYTIFGEQKEMAIRSIQYLLKEEFTNE